jgi:N-acetylglucosaminyl-diphospho-decaprenol L-rhamnosyltransferase
VPDQVGLLDERFFLYFEDVDWCLRVRRAGWRVVYQPEIQVTHLGGASEPGRATANRHYYNSLAAFYRKHYGPFCGSVVRLLSAVYWWWQHSIGR